MVRATPPPHMTRKRELLRILARPLFHGYAYRLAPCRPFPNAKLPYNVHRIATFWQRLLLTYIGTVL
jgi:hypothetical protein